MPTLIQPSFTGGELSPALYPRVDLQKYATGCRTLRNFIVHPEGGASFRGGLEYIATVKDSSRRVHLAAFRYNIEQIYVIEFGHLYCRFFMNGAPIMVGDEPYEIESPYSEEDLPYINYAQSHDMLFITCRNHAPRILMRTGHTNWSWSLFEFKNGPFMNANATATTIKPSGTTGNITLTASEDLFNIGHVGSWWRINTDVDGVYGTVKITGVTDARTASATVQTTLKSTAATTDWAEGAWSDYRGWPAVVMFYQDRLIFGCTPSEPQSYWASKTGDYNNFARSYPLEDTDGITNILTAREVNEIRHLVALSDLIMLTSASEWTVGPISSGGAFTPTTVKQRVNSYWGASYVRPVMIGNRAVYVQPKGTVVRDIGYSFESDGYTGDNLTIFSRHLFENHRVTEIAYQQEPDSILWAVRDDGKLLSLTYLREQQVLAWTHHDTAGKFENVCCVPGDEYDEVWVIVKRGNTKFIERMTPGLTTDEPEDCFFVDCGLRYDVPLRIENIEFTDNKVTITIPGHGLNEGDLVDISNIEWAPDQDEFGNVFQPNQLNKWRFVVADVTADTFTLKDVFREEYVVPVKENGEPWNAYVSGGIARKCVTKISGLDHLEGRQVAALVNGFVMKGKTVVNGQLTLDFPASRVSVGLPYIGDFETLNVDFPTNEGTMQAKKVKISEVTFLFHKSRGGWIGPDANHLTEILQRSTEPSGWPIELFSGEYKQTMNSGFEENGRVFVRQMDPLPLTILSVMPKVTVGG